MDTTTDPAAARIQRFLAEEPVVWLSTVRPDGLPHLVPVWFAWDGEAITIMSKPGAQKIRNLRERPSAMLALGDAEADFDVGLLEATAASIDRPAGLPPAFLAKYAEHIAQLGLTPEQFAATYPQQVRLTPTRALGWHGRSGPSSVVDAGRRLAGARRRWLERPHRRPSRARLGEPLARGLRSLRPALRENGVAI